MVSILTSFRLYRAPWRLLLLLLLFKPELQLLCWSQMVPGVHVLRPRSFVAVSGHAALLNVVTPHAAYVVISLLPP